MPSKTYSLYVHVPFCDVKCSYCAFNIIVGHDGLIPAFVAAAQAEMQQVSQPGMQSHTLYFGGGTPSKLDGKHIAQLLETAYAYLGLQPDAEITLEANPSEHQHFGAYHQVGVNRLSLGLQSLDERQLVLYQRTHTLDEARTAYDAARQAGFTNISFDLIFGAPYQTLSMWETSLTEAVAWGPEHFSLYGLILEPQTKLIHRIRRGDAPTPDEDLTADMYQLARSLLLAAGYEQYEIASFARPGFASRHNQQYWRNLPYLGFGPGAHGYVHPHRYETLRAVPAYIHAMQQPEPASFPFSAAYATHETLTTAASMAETLMLGLRMVHEGINPHTFEQRYNTPLDTVYGDTIQRLKAKNLLTERSGRLLLTEQAYLISNQVFVEFMP